MDWSVLRRNSRHLFLRPELGFRDHVYVYYGSFRPIYPPAIAYALTPCDSCYGGRCLPPVHVGVVSFRGRAVSASERVHICCKGLPNLLRSWLTNVSVVVARGCSKNNLERIPSRIRTHWKRRWLQASPVVSTCLDSLF